MDEPASPATPGVSYEETPIIEPLEATPEPAQAPAAAASSARPVGTLGIFTFIKNFVLFSILFFLGVGTSTVLRGISDGTISLPWLGIERPEEEVMQKIPTPAPVTNVPSDPFAGWIAYTIATATYKLPADVLEPICDGASCVSMGTYLPGGTRFTVAGRGPSYPLRYIAGAQITDVNGTAFTTTETTVAGSRGREFTGTFRGTTVGGYTFSRMRGVMIEVGGALTIEINHFTPSGVTADFEADDILFNEILKTVAFATPSAVPTATPSTTPGITN